MKPLIVYYSRRGKNLVNGRIQNLPVGNTELLATILQKFTDGDIYRIEPVEDYAQDYYRCIDQARQDLYRGIRPELKHPPDSIAAYDVIYLGYPNYWGTMPVAVFSFLERFDFSGKTIKPFCTHEGGGMGRSEGDIQRVCPTAHVSAGLPVRGARVGEAVPDLQAWIQETETANISPNQSNKKRSNLL